MNRRRLVRARTSRARIRRLVGSDSISTISGARRRIIRSRSEVEKIAVSGVGFFPAMPSVGTRRSTRVFVPKTIAKTAPDADLSPSSRRLRSGKRLVVEKSAAGDDWFRWWGNRGASPLDGAGGAIVVPAGIQTPLPEPAAAPAEPGDRADRMFGSVYSRKRRRKSASGNPAFGGGGAAVAGGGGGSRDRMYGIPFVRKQRRKESASKKVDEFSINDFDRKRLLLVFVDSSWSTICHFSRFLLSILSRMRRARLRLSHFVAFLRSDPLASVFTLHGIRFEPLLVESSQTQVHCRVPYGICAIYGARRFVPLVSLNFAALPFYFLDLHRRMNLKYLFYLPEALARFSNGLLNNSCMALGSCGPVDQCMGAILASPMPAVNRRGLDSTVQVAEFDVQNVITRHGAKLRRHQKKRTSVRPPRAPKNSTMHSQRSGISSDDAGLRVVHGRLLEIDASDLTFAEDYLAFSSPRTGVKQKRSSRPGSTEKISKELKSFLVDIKQNIDSACCGTNILVVESDRCWREEGAEVWLEGSNSKEWFVAVKVQGNTKYLHRVHEMRTGSSHNRFTNATLWSGENGWKLEFCDKKDWLIFKELQRECYERNTRFVSMRTIPIPGVKEVLGYEEGVSVPFLRPDVYISVRHDEVERALMSQSAFYDTDSDDEKWLQELNSKSVNGESGSIDHLSCDAFEKIVFVFEKAAYSHPDDVSDVERATSLCVDLGRKEDVAAVFEYWLRKRKHKQLPLVRVFQGSPPKRAQLVPRHFLRKKRSFKRQASRVGRGKPEILLPAVAEKEDLERVQEAELAANSAVEIAIQKRRRAQVLMENADLATYKALVALRLAEVIQGAESADANSLILD